MPRRCQVEISFGCTFGRVVKTFSKAGAGSVPVKVTCRTNPSPQWSDGRVLKLCMSPFFSLSYCTYLTMTAFASDKVHKRQMVHLCYGFDFSYWKH